VGRMAITDVANAAARIEGHRRVLAAVRSVT